MTVPEKPASEEKPEDVKPVDLTAGLSALREEAAREDAPAVDAEDNAAASVNAMAAAMQANAGAQDTAEDWEGAIELAVEWFSDKYPGLPMVYTPARRKRLGEAIHRVALKRGWTISGLFLAWKEEIALLMVAAPVLRDTRKLIDGKGAPAAAAAPRAAARAAASDYDDGTIRPTE